MTEPVLSVDGLSLSRGGRPIINNLSFEVSPGRSLSLMGRSGSGKSSLLMAILGFVPIESGDIGVDDVSLREANGSDKTRLRREYIGTLFQTGELFDGLTVRENLQVAGELRGMPKSLIGHESERLLRRVNIEQFESSVDVLSGGEYQRVSIARALIGGPKLILADEPTGQLDTENRDTVVELLVEQTRETGAALVIVTHDPEVASRTDDRISLAGATR